MKKRKNKKKQKKKNTGTRMQMRERDEEKERERGRCLLEKKFSVDLNIAALFSFVQRRGKKSLSAVS